MVTDRQILEAVLTEVRGFGTRMDKFESRMDGFESRMDRMEERQKRFEEETRNNFADIKLHLENITDRNISILAENHLNLINKMNLDAIHDTVHEMARDEARHGKAFAGLLKRYFGE